METDPSANPTTPPPVTPPSHDGLLRTLFLKDDGLRAGWRLLLYVFFVATLGFSALILISQLVVPERGGFSLMNQFLQDSSGFVAALAAALIMAQIEKRPVGIYGLPVKNAFKSLFWQGYLFGLIEISVVIGLMALCGGYSFGPSALHGMEIVRWGFSWAVCFLFVAFYEEFLFRGYTQFTLSEGIGFWPAAAVLSILFGLAHHSNSGENSIGLAGVMLVGLFWSFTLRRTGNLWFAVGMHAGFDFGETFVFSVPDSGMVFSGHLSNAVLHGPAWLTGGTPGPEASVFDFAILIAFFFIFHRLHPARPARVA
jgi:uncharacterized protein